MAAAATIIPWQDADRPARRAVLVALSLAVAALHAWVLLTGPAERDRGARGPGSRPLQVRQIPAPAGDVVPTSQAQESTFEAVAPNTSIAPVTPAMSGPTGDHGRAAASDKPLAPPGGTGRSTRRDEALAPGRSGGEAAAPRAQRGEPAALATASGPVGPAVTAGGDLAGDAAWPTPVYATRPPASATLHYEMRRGSRTGAAVLDWRRDDGAYGLSLLGTIDGAEALGWVGRGGFDEAGLAPERFVVRRRGRDMLAANFQRGEVAGGKPGGRVTFSGPIVEWPLQPGMQDRVSWIVQLASILHADPALGREDARIELRVVGARGDAQRWTFEARAPQPLELPQGRVEHSLPFVREARHAYDVQVEAWLDPAREYLPVRLRFVTRPGGEVTEFLLRSALPR